MRGLRRLALGVSFPVASHAARPADRDLLELRERHALPGLPARLAALAVLRLALLLALALALDEASGLDSRRESVAVLAVPGVGRVQLLREPFRDLLGLLVDHEVLDRVLRRVPGRVLVAPRHPVSDVRRLPPVTFAVRPVARRLVTCGHGQRVERLHGDLQLRPVVLASGGGQQHRLLVRGEVPGAEELPNDERLRDLELAFRAAHTRLVDAVGELCVGLAGLDVVDLEELVHDRTHLEDRLLVVLGEDVRQDLPAVGDVERRGGRTFEEVERFSFQGVVQPHADLLLGDDLPGDLDVRVHAP